MVKDRLPNICFKCGKADSLACIECEEIENLLEASLIKDEVDPEYSGFYVSRGVEYEKLENYHKAIDDYNKAIELYPSDEVAYYVRGFLYHTLGNTRQASNDFKIAAKLHKEHEQNQKVEIIEMSNQNVNDDTDHQNDLPLEPIAKLKIRWLLTLPKLQS